MRISDWSSDVCSSDLIAIFLDVGIEAGTVVESIERLLEPERRDSRPHVDAGIEQFLATYGIDLDHRREPRIDRLFQQIYRDRLRAWESAHPSSLAVAPCNSLGVAPPFFNAGVGGVYIRQVVVL